MAGCRHHFLREGKAMTEKQVAPYGSWKSPITSALIAADTLDVGEIALDGENTYWSEMRAAEKGRYVVVRRTPDGKTTDVTPPPFNARTRVHEYGGGAYVVANGTVFFSNFADQRLYCQAPGKPPQPATPAASLRYADGVFDRRRGRLICVREDHTVADREATNTIVSIALHSGGAGEILLSGNDFYSNPRVSPDGSRLAWLAWNHPNMPWDGTELWVADLNEDGSLGPRRQVAGGPDESIFQPEWSPDGVLHFVSDRTGWWNLYRWGDGKIVPLAPMAADFALPQWRFGMSTYAFASANRIICTYTNSGTWHLATLDTATGQFERMETPYAQIGSVRAAAGRAVFVAASPTEAAAVVQMDLGTQRCEVLRRSSHIEVDRGYLSAPEAIEFPTEGGRTAHAFYYPPQNRNYVPPEGQRPPLLVMSHGGPTGASSCALRWNTQYWTSRGFAVLDVNYGGSSGYGRDYRRRLDGQWGVVDVDDCVNGALYLVKRGLADGKRLAIRGGSAGGYTTLCALAFRTVFKAGASHFGLSDLEPFIKETHKFESRYLDRLIGPYPERRDLYLARSPIRFTDRLSCPVIFFQGLDDKIVPPNQAETMVEALRRKGLPVAYVPFEGEQHGFRQSEHVKRALDAELYFYSKVFGFAIADPVEPLRIENL
jgi:dipeptidyl aminopeptidase/acylaminoacyl peptidase